MPVYALSIGSKRQGNNSSKLVQEDESTDLTDEQICEVGVSSNTTVQRVVLALALALVRKGVSVSVSARTLLDG